MISAIIGESLPMRPHLGYWSKVLLTGWLGLRAALGVKVGHHFGIQGCALN